VPDEGARKTSGQHAGGSQIAIQLGRDKFGTEDLDLALACGGFHTLRKKGKKVVSEERHKQKHSMAAGS
jgi:hypothetical protein